MLRLVFAAGLLAAALPLAGCGGNANRPVAVQAAAQAPVPSGLVADPPEIADPLCNDGHGVRLTDGHSPLTGEHGLANTAMGDGSTMFAYNAHGLLVLVSLTGSCRLNPRFGHGGVATIRGTAGRPWLRVWAVAPTIDHNVIVAGSYHRYPAVGLVNERGQVVKSFGTDGRVTLPFCYSVGGVAQQQIPPFQIIVDGSYGAFGHHCDSDWIAALSEHGHLLQRFGDGGRVAVPTYGADSGIGSLALLRDGDIVVGTGFGNSGCWGYELRQYGPGGQERTEFEQRWKHFWKGLGWDAFSGGVYAEGDGFTLVGTGQKPCAFGPPLFQKRARGLVAHFRSDGSLVRRPARFVAPMFGGVSGFRLGRDTLLVGTPYANASTLHLTAVLPDGSLDPWFGDNGHAVVRAPWHGESAAFEAAATVDKVGSRAVLIVAAGGGYHQLRAIRIRITGDAQRPPLLPTKPDPSSVAHFRCDMHGGTVGIESCLDRQLLALNGRVNALLQTAWRGLDDQGRRYLAEAQAGWETYVHNDCTSSSGSWVSPSSPHFYVGGTSAPLRYLDCAIKLTRARLGELRAMLAPH